MIEIIKGQENDYSLLIEEKFIEKGIYLVEEVFETDVLTLPIELILCQSTSCFPNNLKLSITPENEDFMFRFIDFIKIKDSFRIKFLTIIHADTWESRYSPKLYLRKIIEHSSLTKGLTLVEELYDAEGLSIEFDFEIKNEESIERIYNEGKEILTTAIEKAELELNGFCWKSLYEKNEEYFSKEIIHPLLVKLGFMSVKYNHGRKEYGKDFTFSDLDKFGQIRNYALQVKAGDISGKVNSKVDEILGQIEDAFTMPYYDIGSKSPKYISTFIIAISGKYKENAKEKIAEKLHKGFYGSVYFLDKEMIINIAQNIWNIKK